MIGFPWTLISTMSGLRKRVIHLWPTRCKSLQQAENFSSCCYKTAGSSFWVSGRWPLHAVFFISTVSRLFLNFPEAIFCLLILINDFGIFRLLHIYDMTLLQSLIDHWFLEKKMHVQLCPWDNKHFLILLIGFLHYFIIYGI